MSHNAQSSTAALFVNELDSSLVNKWALVHDAAARLDMALGLWIKNNNPEICKCTPNHKPDKMQIMHKIMQNMNTKMQERCSEICKIFWIICNMQSVCIKKAIYLKYTPMSLCQVYARKYARKYPEKKSKHMVKQTFKSSCKSFLPWLQMFICCILFIDVNQVVLLQKEPTSHSMYQLKTLCHFQEKQE